MIIIIIIIIGKSVGERGAIIQRKLIFKRERERKGGRDMIEISAFKRFAF